MLARAMQLVLVMAAILLLGCASEEPRQVGDALKVAMRGFVYVGSFPDSQGPIPEHVYDPLPVPSSLESRRRYVFHHAGRIDIARFAVEELPERLRDAGFRVVSSPTSIDHMPSVDPGDRAWSIRFDFHGRTGTISNAVDPALFERGGLVPGGSYEMLIVEVDSGGG